ncbi:MAG: tRNA lysidine(34) synthetase TilS, partial [Thermoguttaceae bacterium]|nr:tRNA lysidine(34) synthetase TilS [Thermoguttaceae bacterium]
MTACSWERHPEEEIQRVFPPEKWRQHRVAIAVSGGADSVSLARAFVSLAENCHQRSQLVFLHVNHQMRGKESDGDADFVRLLAKRHQIPYGEYRVNPGELQRAYQSSGSWEAAARAIRYRLLLTAAEEYECRFLATAHTADDQLETILYRLFRGTGPAGLAGIPFIRPLNDMVLLIRPFLALYRTDIISYLDSLNQSFRVDSSNMSSKYMRNRVRHELIPALDSLFSGDWRTALRRLSQTANEIQSSLLDSEKSLDQKWNVYQAEEHLFQRDLMFTEESGNNPGDGRGKTIRNRRENEPGNRVRNNIERTMEH